MHRTHTVPTLTARPTTHPPTHPPSRRARAQTRATHTHVHRAAAPPTHLPSWRARTQTHKHTNTSRRRTTSTGAGPISVDSLAAGIEDNEGKLGTQQTTIKSLVNRLDKAEATVESQAGELKLALVGRPPLPPTSLRFAPASTPGQRRLRRLGCAHTHAHTHTHTQTHAKHTANAFAVTPAPAPAARATARVPLPLICNALRAGARAQAKLDELGRQLLVLQHPAKALNLATDPADDKSSRSTIRALPPTAKDGLGSGLALGVTHPDPAGKDTPPARKSAAQLKPHLGDLIGSVSPYARTPHGGASYARADG